MEKFYNWLQETELIRGQETFIKCNTCMLCGKYDKENTNQISTLYNEIQRSIMFIFCNNEKCKKIGYDSKFLCDCTSGNVPIKQMHNNDAFILIPRSNGTFSFGKIERLNLRISKNNIPNNILDVLDVLVSWTIYDKNDDGDCTKGVEYTKTLSFNILWNIKENKKPIKNYVSFLSFPSYETLENYPIELYNFLDTLLKTLKEETSMN